MQDQLTNVIVSLLKSIIESKNVWKLIKTRTLEKNLWWLGAMPRAPWIRHCFKKITHHTHDTEFYSVWCSATMSSSDCTEIRKQQQQRILVWYLLRCCSLHPKPTQCRVYSYQYNQPAMLLESVSLAALEDWMNSNLWSCHISQNQAHQASPSVTYDSGNTDRDYA